MTIKTDMNGAWVEMSLLLSTDDFLKAAALGGHPFMGPLSVDTDGDPCISLMQAADMETAAGFLFKLLLDTHVPPHMLSSYDIPF